MKLKFYFTFILAAALMGGQVFADDAKAEKKEKTEKAEKKDKGEKKDKKKQSDEEILKEKAGEMAKALAASETEKVMAHFSDDFTSPQFKDKEALKMLIETGANSGVFNGMTSDGSASKYEIKDEKAVVGPWKFEASGQSGTATFHCSKKGGEWKIYGLELEGVYF